MFEKELKQLDKLNEAVTELTYVSNTLNDRRCDLATDINDFLNDERMFDSAGHAGWTFKDMARQERALDVALNRFDRMLNKVIRERRKLGDLTLEL
jgi:hypothetical protein